MTRSRPLLHSPSVAALTQQRPRTPPRVGAGAPPAAAGERRGRRWGPIAALAALVLAATAWVQQLGWNSATYANDELYGVIGGRLLERDFLFWLTDFGLFNRGPERLVSILQVLPNALLSETPDELRAIHVVLALAYFSAVVPVYALARGLGLARWPAALVAALTIVTPWAVFGATLLTVTVGLPTNMLFMWAAWRAAVRPSLAGDALVLGAAALNTLARTGHAPFTVVALLAVLYAVWHRRPDGEPVLQGLLRLPLRAARTHPLLIGVFAAAALLVATLGITAIVGSAYSSASAVRLPWGSIWFHLRDWFLQLTMATGYLPVLVGAPWLLWQLVRPASRETGVFAAVALGMFFVFVYVTSTHNSVSEERYVAVLAGLPVVAFGAAVFRREAWPLGTLVIGLLAARAIATFAPFTAVYEGYVSYQVAPARLFFQQVGIGRATVLLPGGDTNVVLFATLMMVLAGLVVAVLCAPRVVRRLPALAPRRTLVGVAAVVPVLVLGAMSAFWVLDKYRDGIPTTSYERMAWIEEATDGRPAFMWANLTPETREGRIYTGLLAIHFNNPACCNLWINGLQDILLEDGRLPPAPHRDPPPEYLVTYAGFQPLAFETRVVARSQLYGADMRVERFLELPARAAVRVEGAGPGGELPAGTPVDLRLFSVARQPGRCVSVELVAPPEARRALRYRIKAGRRVLAGRLAPGRTRTVQVPVRGAEQISFLAPDAAPRPPAAPAPLQLGELSVLRCATG